MQCVRTHVATLLARDLSRAPVLLGQRPRLQSHDGAWAQLEAQWGGEAGELWCTPVPPPAEQPLGGGGGGAVLPPPAADLFSSFHPALDLLQKLESLVKEYGSADKAAALAGEQRWPLFMCPHLAPGACPGATLSLAELLSGQLPLPQMAPPTAP